MNSPTRFLDPLHVQIIPGRTGNKIYKTVKAIDYVTSLSDDHPVITIPPGYKSDGASVPRPFWFLFPPSGQYTAAAVLHDFLCDYKVFDSRTSHRIFREAMVDLGVPRRHRAPMYRAVALFGPRWRFTHTPEEAFAIFRRNRSIRPGARLGAGAI